MPLIKKNIEQLNKPLITMTNLNCTTPSSIKTIDGLRQPLSTVEYKKMSFLPILNKISNIDQTADFNFNFSQKVENHVNHDTLNQIKTGEQEINKESHTFSNRKSRSERGGGRFSGARGRGRGRGKNRNRYKNKRKKSPPLPKGILKIQSTFNNTIITISNLKGNVIGWSSAGTNGFKGARKCTAFAAKTTASAAAKKSLDQGLKRAKILVKGVGPGRENALRSLSETGLEIALIRDVTGLPHNGCRPRKKRRI